MIRVTPDLQEKILYTYERSTLDNTVGRYGRTLVALNQGYKYPAGHLMIELIHQIKTGK